MKGQWMLFKENEPKKQFIYFWNGIDSIRIDAFFVTGEKWGLVETEVMEYPEMNSIIKHTWDQNVRFMSFGGKTFEVIASGRM